MTVRYLDFSTSLRIPLSAVTQKLAFLGISGSGKTYGAGKFAEELLAAGAQVVVMDTIGNWFGLRLAADGKKPGLSVPILGGEKGDVPLEPTAGKQVAELIADSRASMVVDVSDFTGGELRRFVTEFATHLLRLKKRSPSPVMVIWEECQDIVPQRVFGEVAAMVGAVEKLIKKGRNYGVGTVLISQRSAAVNKDVLNQIETLFVFRLNAPQDRKAIQDWIVHQSIDVGAMVDELPTLPTGTCFCWSPQWLKVLEKVKVGRKRTFDASATPEFGDEVKAGELAPIDLDKFKAKMSAAIEKAKQENPAVLRAELAQLKTKIRALEGAPAKQAERRVEVPVLGKGDLARLETAINKMGAIEERLAKGRQAVVEEAQHLRAVMRSRPSASAAPALREAARAAQPIRRSAPMAAPTSANGLAKGERAILIALACRAPTPLTKTQVATLAGYSPQGGGFNNLLSSLKGRDYIERQGDDIVATEAGLGAIGPVEAPTDLVELWCEKLPGRARDILRLLAAHPGKAFTKDEIAQAVEMEADGGGFNNYLSALRANRLVTKERGGALRASDALFM